LVVGDLIYEIMSNETLVKINEIKRAGVILMTFLFSRLKYRNIDMVGGERVCEEEKGIKGGIFYWKMKPQKKKG
jgi:hypothetical protein